MIKNPALLARIFDTPLLVMPQKADSIISGILPRFGLPNPPAVEEIASEGGVVEPQLFLSRRGQMSDKGYSVDDGIALIDVGGVLAHRGGFDADSSFVLGYDMIARRLDAAMADPDVKAVATIYHSPGGESAGAFQLAEKRHQYRGTKPMLAIVDELAASAAFLDAAANDEIVITEDGFAGSVGVVMRHINISGMLEKEGIEVEQIFSGARKVDGHQFGPLSDEVRARFSSEIHAMRDHFARAVAQYRGISQKAVLATEAGVFRGQDAIEIGFADRISTADEAVRDLRARVNGGSTASTQLTGGIMPTTEKKPASQPEANTADIEAKAHAKGVEEGIQKGQDMERERIRSILQHEHAQGREAQAVTLALDTPLTPEQAGKVLESSPKMEETGAQSGNAFDQHMHSLGNPDLEPDGSREPMDEESQQSIDSIWDKAYAAQEVGH